ncbi:cobalt transporter CbiM [Desulfovibrio ferrophilus]|uniref:Cobalamin (Vitamin B12) biosynthesis protein CbiM n=1 Tax=Desulfovibrio ferrophilus TaxID=241368 RepID=A0A2Z6AVI5_9BACT|nr:cobalt transporter CbiM [Desulfovibrio ferrophilus]BBD07247.1 cobalamin (vitamin B12) biosynthesis protein CbiM [Desulfovibrio ferrophilus]
MHISEGVLTAPVLGGGAVLAVAGTWLGLRKLDYDRLMTVAILSAAFFVASLIHVPVGVASAHLIMNGLLGAVLGWAAFPAILVGLALQALLFQFGGITVLGVNTFNMAAPAVLCGMLFRGLMERGGRARTIGGFLCGALSVTLSAALTAGSLALAGDGFLAAAGALFAAHVPVMVAEGVVVAFAVSFLGRVRPELLAFRTSA